MTTQRKRVTLCTHDDAFGRALSIVLTDYEVPSVTRLEDVGADTDAVVYSVDGEFHQRALADLASTVPVIILGEEEHLIPAVEANCRGFLPRDVSLEKIADAIDTVVGGGAVVPPDLLGTLLHHLVERRRQDRENLRVLNELTNREKEVFHLAADGLRKEDIGERLYISPATARTHLQRVYRKLGLHSQSELIALAARLDEIDTVQDEK